MNILYICDEYPPGKNGGIGTVVQVLGRELVRQGNQVCVAGLYSYSYGQEDYEEDHGVRVWRFRYGLDLKAKPDSIIHKIINRIPGSIKQHLNGRKAFKRYISFIKALIDEQGIEIIEVPDWNTFAMRIGFLVKWPAFKVPLLVKSHGSYTYFADEMKEPVRNHLRAIDVALYKRADALSAVSFYTAKKNKELFKPDKEIKVLYNAIEKPRVYLTEHKAEHKVIFTGTLIAKKGIFQLLKAWNIVSRKIPAAELIIFGKGDANVLKRFLDREVLDKVKFKGHVSRMDLFTELSTATMAVFPSYSECFALAPMEAMAVGCPVIYTLRSSGKELITDGDNGSLVDPDDVAGISKKIIELMEDRQLQKRYSKRGMETIDHKFNISKIARDHLEYYRLVINNFKL